MRGRFSNDKFASPLQAPQKGPCLRCENCASAFSPLPETNNCRSPLHNVNRVSRQYMGFVIGSCCRFFTSIDAHLRSSHGPTSDVMVGHEAENKSQTFTSTGRSDNMAAMPKSMIFSPTLALWQSGRCWFDYTTV